MSVYLDFAASSPVDKKALEVFVDACDRYVANSSSPHEAGRTASRALEKARTDMLRAFGVEKTHRAIFLSGASEANNLALKGIAKSYANRGKRILLGATEHPSVRTVGEAFREEGFVVDFLPVDAHGHVLPATLEAAMGNDVILVSVMGVNNETGAINDLKALADIVHRYPKAFFHSDLTQAIGKEPIPFGCLDLFSFSSHKIHGMKGSGALVFKSQIRLYPLVHGGDQEGGIRSGTVPVPLALSTAYILGQALSNQKANREHATMLRAHLLERLKDMDVTPISSLEDSPFILNFALNRHKASVIVEGLSRKGFYVSSVSACSARLDATSYVLLAMGRSEEEAGNSIRVSFDASTSVEDIDAFADTMSALLKEVHPR